MTTKRVALVGGRGFVGSALVKTLLQHHYTVDIVSRQPPPQQLPAHVAWRTYSTRIDAQLLEGCDCVVNLAGILNQRIFHPDDFTRVHVQLVENICQACRTAGIERYLHLSALNVSPEGPSEYLKTKYQGETLALNSAHLRTTSFRPSVIFGPQDSFLNRFAGLLNWTPWLFPLACAETLFAPVYVGDVAERVVQSIDDAETYGRHLNLCGPKRYTLKQIIEYTAALLAKRVRVIALPNSMAYLQAAVFNWLPGRPFSIDNYLSLQVDSVCDSDDSLCQVRMEEIAPRYLGAH